jgi:TfoX/Sxy family transcriptional regulator of competence genes
VRRDPRRLFTRPPRILGLMPWVKVPPENHAVFRAALPDDPRVETLAMFGGVAARVNGHVFAGLFGRSTMLLLPEPDRAEALGLEGAAPFDPMGDGRARSDKVMLPESIMCNHAQLRRWIARAFEGAVILPEKKGKVAKKKAKKPAPAKSKSRSPGAGSGSVRLRPRSTRRTGIGRRGRTTRP